jgi:cell wall-associated NlpC family hydrolase
MSTTHRRFLPAPARLVAAVILALVVVVLPPGPDADALSPPAGERIVKIAASKRGAPYAYGASGPHAFDCSGFTRWVYARAGRHLPHSSAGQAAVTRRVPARQSRRGDLVFFTSGGHVYHVGVYAGHGRIWHSPRPGTRVRLERIWTPSHFFGRHG